MYLCATERKPKSKPKPKWSSLPFAYLLLTYTIVFTLTKTETKVKPICNVIATFIVFQNCTYHTIPLKMIYDVISAVPTPPAAKVGSC